MQGVLRLVQLLSMVAWSGGIMFFAFVLAPTAFHTLPTVHLAGLIVGAALKEFDGIGMVCGVLFLGVTALMFRNAPLRIRGRYEIEFLLVSMMLVATAYLHWNVIPSMDSDQRQVGGDMALAEATNPAKIHFDKLHTRSERVEGTVLVLSLSVLFLMSREQLRIEV
jgi:uncharacterized membrane protein